MNIIRLRKVLKNDIEMMLPVNVFNKAFESMALKTEMPSFSSWQCTGRKVDEGYIGVPFV